MWTLQVHGTRVRSACGVDFFFFGDFLKILSLFFFNTQGYVFFTLILEKEERGEQREREKQPYEREISVSCLPYAPQSGLKPTN